MDYFAAVQAFLRAAELHSFSKAAERLAVKTSTVSRQIGDLEKDLGVALFNRSTRGLALTEAGKTFRQHAQVSLEALEEARDAASSLNASPKGFLRVTMPTSFGRRHVIRHLPDFMARYPAIDVDAIVTDTQLNLIESGIDLAIRIGALPDSQLMARRLAPHHRVAYASPEYVERHGTPRTPAELESHAALRFSLAPDDRWLLVDKSGRREEVAVRLRGRFRANDTDALLEMALAGCGIALLPTWSVGTAAQEGMLVPILPDWEARSGKTDPAVWAVWPPKKVVASKVRAFVDYLVGMYGRDGYWDR